MEKNTATILTMGDLANTYDSLGKYTEAEKLQIKVLDLGKRLLGEECSIQSIQWKLLQQHFTTYKNIHLEVQVIDVREKVFGEQHQKTVKAVALLAEIRSQADINTSGIQLKNKIKSDLLWNLASSLMFIFRPSSFQNCK